MKTPCLAHKQKTHRLLLAQCYHQSGRYVQQVQQLQRIKEVSICTNMTTPPHHHSYLKLLAQLHHAYEKIQYSGYIYSYMHSERQWESTCQKYKIEGNINEVHYKVISIKTLYNQMLTLTKINKNRIKEQREKLQKIMNTQGRETYHYVSQHYILIYLLYREQVKKYTSWQYQKRNYQEVIEESIKFFKNKKHKAHRHVTIELLKHLFQTVDGSKKSRVWACFLSRQLTQFLAKQICHHQEIEIIYECVRLCASYGNWMGMKKLLAKLTKTQIECPISEQTYEKIMKLYTYMWSRDKQNRVWVESTEQRVHKLHQHNLMLEKKQQKEFVRFPRSIAQWENKQSFKCVLKDVEWVCYQDMMKGCEKIQASDTQVQHSWEAERQLEHLSHDIQQNIQLMEENFMEGKLEVKGWQEPCTMCNKMDGVYGVNKHISKADITMVVLYLHHHHLLFQHPAQLQALKTTNKLHIPRETEHELNTLLQQPHLTAQSTQPVIKTIQTTHHGAQHNRRNELRKVDEISIVSQQTKHDCKHHPSTHHREASEWRQVQSEVQHRAELFLIEESLLKRNLHSLHRTKQYCELSLACVTDMDRVVIFWDGHQQGFSRRSLHTMERLHGRNRPLPPQQRQVYEGEGSSLAAPISQQTTQEISSLKQKEYLLPTLKALFNQDQLPIELIEALFSEQSKCKEIVKRLFQKQQYREKFSHEPQQQLVKDLQHQNFPSSEGKKTNDEKQEIRFRKLVEEKQLHEPLIQLFLPIIQNQPEKKEDHEEVWRFSECDRMKDGLDALARVCVRSRSCLHDEQSTPRWWPTPSWPTF